MFLSFVQLQTPGATIEQEKELQATKNHRRQWLKLKIKEDNLKSK